MAVLKRYAHFLKEIVRRNFYEPEFPLKLNLQVTDFCNMRCKTCGIWKKKPANELTFNELETFFKKNNWFSWIDVTGGEIFVRKDVAEILELVDRSCKDLVMLHFPTNGYMSEKIVDTVRHLLPKLSVPKLSITVSLDGDKETNDFIRGKNDGFDKAFTTYRGLKKIRDGKLKLFLGMTISSYNVPKFEEIRTGLFKIKEFDIVDLHFNIAQKSSIFYGESEMTNLTKEEAERVLDSSGIRWFRGHVSPINNLEYNYQYLSREFMETGQSPLICQAVRNSVFVNPKGSVYPCIMWDKKIGDLRESGFDLRPILNSEIAKSVKTDLLQKNCPQCWTPCEAYQTILSSYFPFNRWKNISSLN